LQSGVVGSAPGQCLLLWTLVGETSVATGGST
jgi:hypothetical protein